MKPAKIIVDREQHVLFEQLALKRLKTIGSLSRRHAPTRKSLNATLLFLLKAGRLLLDALLALRPLELERQVAPGVPGQKQHEWEKLFLGPKI